MNSRLKSIHFAKALAQQAFKFYERRYAVRFLTQRGFTVLGRGAFATTLGHPDHPEVVIKVASTWSRRFTYWRDGFSTYAHWLFAARSRSKFAPRIYHFQDDARHSVTVMERLYKLDDKTTQRRVNRTADALCGWNVEADEIFAPTSHFRKFVDRFRRLGQLDLHSGNVMRRVNGDLVITDPLLHPC